MQRVRVVRALVAVGVAALLSSCAGAVSDEYVIEHDPGRVEHGKNGEAPRVILEASAIERLQLRTDEMRHHRAGLVVPMDAVFVQPDGSWWVYTNPEPGVYVRHEVEIARERDGVAVLSEGPPPGTDIVVVGVAELHGVEAEVGH